MQDTIRKPVNLRATERVLKIPPSAEWTLIRIVPESKKKRFMLEDLPVGSDLQKPKPLTPSPLTT